MNNQTRERGIGRRLVEDVRRARRRGARTNGTAARRMLNAIPPARKKTLSSPALSQTRLA